MLTIVLVGLVGLVVLVGLVGLVGLNRAYLPGCLERCRVRLGDNDDGAH